jgi:hypothetical protein
MRILARGNKSARLVQKDVKRLRLWSNEFAIDFDVVALVGLSAEVGAGLSVDRDAPARDEFVAMSSRTDTGCGEITIETQT